MQFLDVAPTILHIFLTDLSECVYMQVVNLMLNKLTMHMTM